MVIARVIGDVVAAKKLGRGAPRKALLVQPLNLDGTNRGDAAVALKSVYAGVGNAGVGDVVLLAREATDSPIDMTVIGVIDRVELFPAPMGAENK
jgi:microcompartment protein CcmK/EutM